MAGPEQGLRESIASAASTGRRRGRRATDDWRTSLLLLLALLAVLYGLHGILSGLAWFFQLALVGVLVLGASAVTRLLTARAWLPPVVSIVAFVAAMTAAFAPSTAVLAVIPTGDSIAVVARLFALAGRSIAEQGLPAVADTGITFLLCIGVAGIALVADLFAIRFRSPALAGIPLLVLLITPGYIDPGSSDPLAFLLAAIVYLVLLRVGSRRGQGRLSLGLGAIALALALVLPLVLPPIDGGPNHPEAGAFGTGVNPVLSLGSDLRQSASRTVLSYHTSEGDPHYLRLASVDDFTGSSWAPDAFTLDRRNTVDHVAPAPGLTGAIARTKDTTTVDIRSLTSTWLPLPYPTTSIAGLDGSWYWDQDGHAVSSPDRGVNGQSYTITDLELDPTPDQLIAAGTAVPSGFGRFLAVPKNLPAIVSETARKVVGTAPTNYEKALLLQSFFHDGDFEYSETAPVEEGYDGTGGQVIAKFLRAKSGYCIHFASAMAVMARVLGIPSRISVGFLPGREVPGGDAKTYQVDSHDLHAWPELYFEGIGWTRFEPTVGRGDVPDYADLSSPDVPVPSASDNPTPTVTPAPTTKPPAPTATPAPDSTTTAQAPVASPVGVGSWVWIAAIVLLLLVLAFAPAGIRAAQRSRRLRRLGRARAPALIAWREVLQSSEDAGAAIADTLTPREAAALLAGGTLVDDPALARLLAALEWERFARDTPVPPAIAADTRRVVGLVLAHATGRARVLATLFPPSIWSAVLRLTDRR